MKLLKWIAAAFAVAMTLLVAGCGGGGGSSGSNPNQQVLTTTAPSTLALQVGSIASYQVSGGVPPYRVGNSQTSVANATIDGTKLNIAGLSVGTTAVDILDHSGAKISIAVSVAGTLTTNAPATVTLMPGSVVRYQITGGVGPYRVTNPNSQIASASVVNGNVLEIAAAALGSVSFDLRDSANDKVTVDVTVGSSVPLRTTAPAEVILMPDSGVQYEIAGGVAPYRVVTSDRQVAYASVDGSRLLINAVSAGSATIEVVDNAGARVPVKVTVAAKSTPLTTSAPSTLTIGVGPASTRTFTIRGGVPPYNVQSSNLNVFTVTRSGNDFSVTGVAIGAGTLTVTDGANAKVDIAVTVGAPELRVSPTDLKIFPGIDAVVQISGGQPPYRVAGGIPPAIQVTIVGDQMHIKGLLASKLDVTVADATGQTAKVTVEVTNGTGQFNIMPGTLSITEDDNQDIRLNIYGAAPGPVCFYTDRTQLQPQVSGCPTNPSSVTLVTGSAGSRCVNGNTPVTLTAVDTLGAVATAVVTIVDNGGCATQTSPVVASTNAVTLRRADSTATPPVPAATAQVLVTGGSGQYTVTSPDSNVATATMNGNVLSITSGTQAGTVTLRVYDQRQLNAAPASITVTVQ